MAPGSLGRQDLNNEWDNQKAERMERNWKRFVGVCAYHASVGTLIGEDETKWLKDLCTSVNEMFPEERQLSPEHWSRTVESWRGTFKTLVEDLGYLCYDYPEYWDLEVAFEYVIPTSDPAEDRVLARRADVVIFGRDRVAVLEFKTGKSRNRIEAKTAKAIEQVNHYLRGLNDWHRYATPDELRGCVVMFAENDLFEDADYPIEGFEPAAIVSKDCLGAFLMDCFQGHCAPVRNPGQWLRAFGTETNLFEEVFGEIVDCAAEHFDEMPELDGKEKADIRRRIARRLHLRNTLPLRALIAALTNGKWQLRDAVVQLLENLPQNRLETLFNGWREQS